MVKVAESEQAELIKNLVRMESGLFGKAHLNKWSLIPLIRHGIVFYIEEDGMVIGTAQFMKDWDEPKKAYLAGIFILKAFRGKGVGAMLIADCVKSLLGTGIEKIELMVDPTNKPAISMFTKEGFVMNGIRKDEYGRGINRLVMVRQRELK